MGIIAASYMQTTRARYSKKIVNETYGFLIHPQSIDPTTILYDELGDFISPLLPEEIQCFEHLVQAKQLQANKTLSDQFCSVATLLCANLDEYAHGSDEVLHVLTDGDFLSRSLAYRNPGRDHERLTSSLDPLQQSLTWFLECKMVSSVMNNEVLQVPAIEFSNFASLLRRTFLPQSITDKFGELSMHNLPSIMAQFHIDPDSLMAKVMGGTVEALQHLQSDFVGEQTFLLASKEDLTRLLDKLLEESKAEQKTIQLFRSFGLPMDNIDIHNGIFTVVAFDLKGDIQSEVISCHSPNFHTELCGVIIYLKQKYML